MTYFLCDIIKAEAQKFEMKVITESAFVDSVCCAGARVLWIWFVPLFDDC